MNVEQLKVCLANLQAERQNGHGYTEERKLNALLDGLGYLFQHAIDRESERSRRG